MNNGADASGLIESAYMSALDADLWQGWTASLRDALGGINATFSVANARTRAVEMMLPLGPCENLIDEYRAYWGQFDPQLHRAAAARQCSLYADTDYVDLADPATAEFWRWQSTGGFEHHITATAVLGNEGLRGVVSVHSRIADGPVSDEQRRLFGTIFPDLMRALHLGFRHRQLLDARFWEGYAQAGGTIAVLLDERGRVMRATGTALAIAAGNDGLTISNEQLRCAVVAEDAALRQAITRALAPASASGAVRVTRGSGRQPYILVIYPLPRRRRMLAPLEGAAIVKIVDPGQRDRDLRALLIQAFALTPREAEVANLLHDGHSIESLASAARMAMPTARLHLRRIFEKTGTTRQSELVALMARLD